MYIKGIGTVVFIILFFAGCKKYLEAAPKPSIRVPLVLADLQSLLDVYSTLNNHAGVELGEALTDNYYLTSADWSSRREDLRLLYIWDKDATEISDWRDAYANIFIANYVLDQLPQMEDATNSTLFNDIKGQALFFRSFAFWSLVQIYCRSYSSTAATDLGIPLRLTSSMDEKIKRATVQETYDQIIHDLKEAVEGLPETVPAVTRPKKAAAYALLARVYLSIRDYENAGLAADACLIRQGALIDFNGLNPGPLPMSHPEMIFYSISLNQPGLISNTRAKIDSMLYNSYHADDLRKKIFFRQNADGISYAFIGSYVNTSLEYICFTGLATDEVYLTRAECSARMGNKDSAMADLNRLMSKRWKNTVSFPTFTANDATDALHQVLAERRKELVYRQLRWTDIRRFNEEDSSITLKRIINGTTYSLPPNDPRGMILIPWEVITESGIQQNPR